MHESVWDPHGTFWRPNLLPDDRWGFRLAQLSHPVQYVAPDPCLPLLRFVALRAALEELSMDPPEEGDSLRFLRSQFVAGDPADVITEPHAWDLAAIATVVRNAARQADYTLVTIHAHEGDKSRFVPAQFLVTFARALINEGADVFVGHGPHVLRAVEIYKGKPILYSLGDFLFQNETLQRLPHENYARYELGEDNGLTDFNDARYENNTAVSPATPEIWESVVARPVFEGDALVELRLHPFSLGFEKARTVRGRPMFADEALGRKILDDLKLLSEPFGTEIDYVHDVGVVRLAMPTSN